MALESQEARIAKDEKENILLKEQVETLKRQLDRLKQRRDYFGNIEDEAQKEQRSLIEARAESDLATVSAEHTSHVEETKNWRDNLKTLLQSN